MINQKNTGQSDIPSGALQKTGVLTTQHRTLVLLAWVICMAAGAFLIARASFSADLSAFLPRAPDPRQQVLIEQLQSGIASRTVLIGIDGGAASERTATSLRLGQVLRQSKLFDQVQNGDLAEWSAAGQWLFEHRYQLSPAVDAARFTTEGLRDAIGDTVSLLGTPAGNAIKPLLPRDPTGETQRIAEGLIPASAPRSEDGVWVARDRPRALLLVTTHASGDDLDGQAAAIAGIRKAFGELNVPALRLIVTGAPVFAVDSRDQIKGEATHLAIVGGIVMGALLLLAFASARALFFAFLPVATGVVSGTVAVSLCFGTVHGLTMGFGSTLIGETVDYAIYYLIQARVGAGQEGPGWQIWRNKHWPTVRLGLLTSVCGFAALVFSGFPGLSQLGVFSVAGLLAAAMATRYVLPVLAPNGASGLGLRARLADVAQRLVTGMPHWRAPILMIALAAFGLVVWQGGSLWRGDLSAMSPVPLAAQALDAELRADLGASDARVLVVVQGATEQLALERTEHAVARLEKLVERGALAGFDAVTRVLPSLAVQQARLASIPATSVLTENLRAALQTLPLSEARLSPFVNDVQAASAQPLLTRGMLAGSPVAPIVNALFFQRPSGGWSTVVALHPGASFDVQTLRTALRGVDGVQAIDVKDVLDGLYGHYLRQALLQVAAGAIAVLLLLGAYLRSIPRLLAVCQPLVVAVVLVLGGMAALGMALGVLHLVGVLLIVAVGSNYALFFDQIRQLGRADQGTLASLLLANVTTVVSFGLIALSDIPALSAIGRVVAPGALLALLLSAAFTTRTTTLAGASHVNE